ncbi:GNAT family N-acetyltransferase [Chloroflexota bacterium]
MNLKDMSTKFKSIIIEGNLVKLRPIKASDAQVAYPMLKREELLSWLLWDGPKDEKEVFNTYSQWGKEFGKARDYQFAIERLNNPGIIGSIGLEFPEHEKQADIGYWLGYQFWNNGYMTDALRLICSFGFHHLGIVRIYAPIFKGNIRSWRVLEKNGFSMDGTLRNHILKRGEWRDAWFMSLIRTDWEKQKEYYRPQSEIQQ